MKCVNCGTEYEGEFCPKCGKIAETQPSSTSMWGQNSASQQQNKMPPFEANTAKRKKSGKSKKPIYKRWWFYVIVGIALIAVLGSVFGGDKPVKIKWDEMVLGEQLPEPPATKGEIHENSADRLWVDIKNISDKQYADYVDACKEMEFTVDCVSNSSAYSAYNADGYKLSLSHYGDKSDLSIKLEKPMEMSEISWPDSKAGNQLPAPESTIGKFAHEYDDNFFVYIGNTSKTDYNDYIKACSDMGFTVNYNKGDNYYYADNGEGWHISLKYEGNNIMSIDIDAPSNKSAESTAAVSETEKASEAKTEEIKSDDTELVDGMHKDFKKAMDSYEAFMNEYVEFIKKYQNNPSDAQLIADYAKYMSKYADLCDKFDKWESEDLNDTERAYYIDVQARVSKKLLEIAN